MSFFTSFTEISWEAAEPPIFSLGVVSQILINVLGTLQLSMASMDRLPNNAPTPTHAAAVVTTPTLWWCTSRHDPCTDLDFLTLDPIDTNTTVLSLLIPSPHKFMTKLGLIDKKPSNLVNC